MSGLVRKNLETEERFNRNQGGRGKIRNKENLLGKGNRLKKGPRQKDSRQGES